jgi:hypothetical protein
MIGEKPEPQYSLPQVCYGLAYYLLPQTLFSDLDKTLGYFSSTRFPPGAYLYAMACSYQKATPQREDALLFHTHSGSLTNASSYYVVEYPIPPPFDISNSDAVLAPLFSAIVHYQSTNEVAYYVLGQGPLGGTTLRAVQRDGTNANLGKGPNPVLNDFLGALRGKN